MPFIAERVYFQTNLTESETNAGLIGPHQNKIIFGRMHCGDSFFDTDINSEIKLDGHQMASIHCSTSTCCFACMRYSKNLDKSDFNFGGGLCLSDR